MTDIYWCACHSMLRVLCAVDLDGWIRPGVTESQSWQTSWDRSIGAVDAVPGPAK